MTYTLIVFVSLLIAEKPEMSFEAYLVEDKDSCETKGKIVRQNWVKTHGSEVRVTYHCRPVENKA